MPPCSLAGIAGLLRQANLQPNRYLLACPEAVRADLTPFEDIKSAAGQKSNLNNRMVVAVCELLSIFEDCSRSASLVEDYWPQKCLLVQMVRDECRLPMIWRCIYARYLRDAVPCWEKFLLVSRRIMSPVIVITL